MSLDLFAGARVSNYDAAKFVVRAAAWKRPTPSRTNGVRKLTYRDADGNESFGGAPVEP